ncbi:MAG: acetylxylan esterase [Clostridia bacterium]|nr:acetylxylan esterase [Clostridia bacterium]
MNKQVMPWKYNLSIIENIKPALRYDGSEGFATWQSRARAKLAELLGMDKLKKPEVPAFEIEYEKEQEGFTEYRIRVESEVGYSFPCVMLVPRNRAPKMPMVFCLQGHSTGMHVSLGRARHSEDAMDIEGDRDFAIRALREGCVAVAIEQRNFGECGAKENGAPDCHVSSMSAILCGRTTIGERVCDVSAAIDVVTSHFDFVDEERIILLGNSGGGTATFYAAAMDERISVAVPSCAVCTYKHSIAAMEHCVCNFVPHIAEYFDMGDIGGLIAPRALVVVNGRLDPIFPDAGVRETYAVIEELYRAADAPDRCRLVTGEGDHRFYADPVWPQVHDLLG